MPDRILRAGILTSDAVNQLSWAAEVFYRRLMSVVDDYGRYDGRPSILRATIYPLKLDNVSEPDVVKWIRETEEAGLVRGYVVSGKRYIEVLKFDQRLRAKVSKWPPPPAVDEQAASSANGRGHLPADVSNSRSSAGTRGHPSSNAAEAYSEAEARTETENMRADARPVDSSPGETLPDTPAALTPYAEVMDSLAQCYEGPIPQAAAQGAALKRLLKNYQPAQIIECLQWLRSEPWTKGVVNLMMVESKIGGHLKHLQTHPDDKARPPDYDPKTHYPDGRVKPKHKQGFVC